MRILILCALVLATLTGCAPQPAGETTAVTAQTGSPETTIAPTEGEPTMPKEYTVHTSDLTVPKGDQQIYGKLYTPEGSGKFPVILFSHGYNGIHADFDRECKFFASRGYICYAFDFCGGSTRSKSSGKTTDMTIFTEKEDLLAVLDHFRAMEQADADNIFLLGGSQGGLVTALAAADRPAQVKAVVLYFPALNIPDNWRHNYPEESTIPDVTDFWGLKLGRNFFTSMRKLDPYLVIDAYQGNVLILHGDQDTIVPLSSSQFAADTYKNAQLIVLKGEGHGFTPNGLTTVMEHTLNFLLAQ